MFLTPKSKDIPMVIRHDQELSQRGEKIPTHANGTKYGLDKSTKRFSHLKFFFFLLTMLFIVIIGLVNTSFLLISLLTYLFLPIVIMYRIRLGD